MKFIWTLHTGREREQGEQIVEVGPGSRVELEHPQLLNDREGNTLIVWTSLEIVDEDTIKIVDQPIDPKTSRYSGPPILSTVRVPPESRDLAVRGVRVVR